MSDKGANWQETFRDIGYGATITASIEQIALDTKGKPIMERVLDEQGDLLKAQRSVFRGGKVAVDEIGEALTEEYIVTRTKRERIIVRGRFFGVRPGGEEFGIRLGPDMIELLMDKEKTRYVSWSDVVDVDNSTTVPGTIRYAPDKKEADPWRITSEQLEASRLLICVIAYHGDDAARAVLKSMGLIRIRDLPPTRAVELQAKCRDELSGLDAEIAAFKGGPAKVGPSR